MQFSLILFILRRTPKVICSSKLLVDRSIDLARFESKHLVYIILLIIFKGYSKEDLKKKMSILNDHNCFISSLKKKEPSTNNQNLAPEKNDEIPAAFKENDAYIKDLMRQFPLKGPLFFREHATLKRIKITKNKIVSFLKEIRNEIYPNDFAIALSNDYCVLEFSDKEKENFLYVI